MSPVQITVSGGSAAEATAIVREVVQRRLAAAGQCWPIQSTYWWEDELVNREEIVVLFKTLEARVDEIIEVIGSLHSYEVPSIFVVPVQRLGPGTADWLRRATSSDAGRVEDALIPEFV